MLFADDDRLLRAIVCEALRNAAYRVIEAADGISALELAREHRPECVLLDVMMPQARGLEVCRELRRDEGPKPFVAMVSARVRLADRTNALAAGADAYLEKPFEPARLVELVARGLAERTRVRSVDLSRRVWLELALTSLGAPAPSPPADRPRWPRPDRPVLEVVWQALLAGTAPSRLGMP